MERFSRRGFTGLSLGAMSALALPPAASAMGACAAGARSPFPPNLLLVDCATRQNFQLFRRYSAFLGLAGVVSMTRTSGAFGAYGAGSLMLFPWLKPAGQKLRGATFHAVLPTGSRTSKSAKPVPSSAAPPDEYFCRLVLQAPWPDFIGFSVDVPGPDSIVPDLRTTIPKLADGQAVEIDWSSINLNRGWFGGSNVIPGSNVCDGSAWRLLIANALNQVSANAC